MAFDFQAYASKVHVSDGAWGTQLQRLGLAPGLAPERWNADNPERVEMVAQSYVQAGSDIILTNTFGANRYVLEQYDLKARTADLAEAGVKISRQAAQAAGRDVKVFASLGPTGKIVMAEDVPAEELQTAFTESAEALAWGGADAIVLETFNELDEARLALRGVRKATDLPVIVCLTFSSGPDRTVTMMGNKPADLAKMAEQEGASAVGANCGAGPENYVKVAQLLRAATGLPIWIKPNAGLPVIVKGQTTFPMGAEEFAAFVPQLIQAGANFIGGCCGTTPQHIQAVRKTVDALAKK